MCRVALTWQVRNMYQRHKTDRQTDRQTTLCSKNGDDQPYMYVLCIEVSCSCEYFVGSKRRYVYMGIYNCVYNTWLLCLRDIHPTLPACLLLFAMQPYVVIVMCICMYRYRPYLSECEPNLSLIESALHSSPAR